MQITIKGAVHVTDVLVNSALLTQMLSKEQFTCEIVSNTESKVLADNDHYHYNLSCAISHMEVHNVVICCWRHA